MKNTLPLLIILLLSKITFTQTTLIPDPNFEQALIDLGHDSGFIDGVVLTANIDAITSLYVSAQNISDLTGIEAFVSLTELHCSGNQLTSLNTTQNTLLYYLYCYDNNITSLDLTQNVALFLLSCSQNQLNNLNLTQNIGLDGVDCWGNPITNINLTQNPNLNYLNCSNSQLTCINVRNGNNDNFTYFNATNNLNLTCVEVDNINSWFTSNFTVANGYIDAGVSYSTNCDNDCSIVGIEESNILNVSIYPNPTTGNLFIDLEELKGNVKMTLTNNLGQVILTQEFEYTNYINIDVDAPKGIYFLQLETGLGEIKSIKIVKI